MFTTKTQECPLCSATAEYEITADGQGKRFTCTNCSKFIVTLEAEQTLKALDANLKQKMLVHAKETSFIESIYFISCQDKKNPLKERLGFEFPIDYAQTGSCLLQGQHVRGLEL